jgi:hypothetical protein
VSERQTENEREREIVIYIKYKLYVIVVEYIEASRVLIVHGMLESNAADISPVSRKIDSDKVMHFTVSQERGKLEKDVEFFFFEYVL